MRVGVVVYGALSNTSGGFLYDRQLVDRLRSHGASVEVIDLPWRTYTRHLLDNVRPAVTRRLAATEVDIWLQDELCHPSLVRVNARLPEHEPVVTVVHHLRSSEPRSRPANWLYRQVERAYLRTVNGVIANSRATRSSVTALVDEVEMTIAPPGTGRFDPDIDATSIEARARQSGPLRVVFVGRLIPRKGLDTLLDGLARLPAEAWQLSVIGDRTALPQYADSIRRRVDRHGVADRVRFTGPVANPALADELARGHVLAIPSRYEGFGLAYLEGMGFGLPPLATTAGGAADLVTDGVNGWLVPPDDPAAVAETLQTVMEDRARLADLGRAARNRYEAHPSWSESMDRASSFLKAVANV